MIFPRNGDRICKSLLGFVQFEITALCIPSPLYLSFYQAFIASVYLHILSKLEHCIEVFVNKKIVSEVLTLGCDAHDSDLL